MKKVSITELKNSVSALIDTVRNTKQIIIVCDRNVPVVKLSPLGLDDHDDDQDLVAQLARQGTLLPAQNSQPSLAELRNLRVKPKNNKADLLEALLTDREESR